MRTALALTFGALVALSLTACSAEPPPPDAAEVQTWLSEQSAQADDSLGQLGGLAASTREADGSGPGGSQGGARLDYDEPLMVTALEFSCFGATSMNVEVQVTTKSSSHGASTERVRCEDGPLSIDIDSGTTPVTAVSANGLNERGIGAWSVVVR